MKKSVAVMVGTRKGGYILRGDRARQRWRIEGPLFPGEPVYHMVFDPRDAASMYAACNLTWGGPKIRVSRDLGKTWTVGSNPKFPEGSGHTFQRTWHVEPGHESQPDVVWAGTAPAGLFKSTDRGLTWEPVRGLIEHPTSAKWSPGGAGETALHSIGIDAGDARRIAIAISSGGAYLSEDGGATWRPWNQGTRAEFLPEKNPEVGQCVHHLVAHPTRAGTFFQRNHNFVYFREPAEAKWQDATGDLPTKYGFAGTTDPHDPDTAYVIPLDEQVRLSPPANVAVYRTVNRGKTWKRADRGIPKGTTAEVMREGLTTDRLDPVGVYFGTISGEVWGSNDGARSWQRLAAYLPPILSVGAATLG